MGDEIFVEGEDNFVETWRDGLDESMRGEKCLEGIKSFPDLSMLSIRLAKRE